MRINFCVFTSKFNRLDKFLSDILNLSRRKLNYLFSKKKILVNGLIAKKSDKVIKKSIIQIHIEEEGFVYSDSIKIIKETDNFIVVYKPPKFHTQELFKNKISVENFLKLKFGKKIRLLNRLDYESQGLIIVAKNDNFYRKYKDAENKKLIKKYYLTFVNGKIFSPKIINFKIDQRKRKTVRVLKNEFSDIVETHIYPLAVYNNFTIIIAEIFKGARHQIRAHLGFIGHPLVGDVIYGKINQKKFDFFLFCFGYNSNFIKLNIFETKKLKEDSKKFLHLLISGCS